MGSLRSALHLMSRIALSCIFAEPLVCTWLTVERISQFMSS